MTHRLVFGLLGLLLSSALYADLKINDLQYLSTHNSYKEFMPTFVTNAVNAFCAGSLLPDYQHLPIETQLEKGVRQFEIDVFADPQGGRYHESVILSTLGEDGWIYDDSLAKPGFKVMHEPNIDFHTRCQPFTNCLQRFLSWSNAHPNHLPLFIQLEIISEPPSVLGGLGDLVQGLEALGWIVPLPITDALLQNLQDEIRSVIPLEKIITPDQIRGNFPTLKEAVLANNWPTLAESRGKFGFIMDTKPDVYTNYVQNYPSFRGQLLFAYTEDSSTDEAAFIIMNNPKEGNNAQQISSLVSQGFIVRTRADSETVEAYANDTSTREAALSSGAQFVSTDYIVPAPETKTDYHVWIPNGNPARCNPVRTTPCNSTMIAE